MIYSPLKVAAAIILTGVVSSVYAQRMSDKHCNDMAKNSNRDTFKMLHQQGECKNIDIDKLPGEIKRKEKESANAKPDLSKMSPDQQCDTAIKKLRELHPQARQALVSQMTAPEDNADEVACAKKIADTFGLPQPRIVKKEEVARKAANNKSMDDCINEVNERYKVCMSTATTGPQAIHCKESTIHVGHPICAKKHGY